MEKMKIKEGIYDKEERKFFFISDDMNKIVNKYLNIFQKKFFYFFLYLFLLHFFVNKYYFTKKNIKKINIKPFIKYIIDCKKHKRYKRTKIINKNPYISICLPSLNMEKYIEQTLLSIINQSFQNFEIIIVNDNSKDNTEKVLNNLKLEDDRIKIINHLQNKGVYYSRVEAVLNSNGKYIILMDPDDLFLNENLFQELYNFNLKYNLDIIEFKVYHQIEGRRNIIYPKKHYETHFHNFSDFIISQPNLSNILFQIPGKQIYTHTICRNIWNKMIRRKVLIDMHEYIGPEYFNSFVITSDDIVMNVISYNFAQNYTNIDIFGYMYNIRPVSMSRGDGGVELKKIRTINYLLYFKILYKFIKQFKKSRKILYNELKNLKRFIYFIKDCNIISYVNQTKSFLIEILNDYYSEKNFKLFVTGLFLYLEKDEKKGYIERFKNFFNLN